MTADPEYSSLLRRYRAAGGVDLREQLHDRYLQLARGGVTPAGLPYPDPGDPVAEGASAIRALAEAIPTVLLGTVNLPTPATTLKELAASAYPGNVTFAATPKIILNPDIAPTTGYVTTARSVAVTVSNFGIRYIATGNVGSDRVLDFIVIGVLAR